jgi:hypothetical protein
MRGPVERLGQRTAKLKSVHFKATHTYWSQGRRTQQGTLSTWFDKPAKKFLSVDKWQNLRSGGRSTWSSGVLVNDKGVTTWHCREEEVKNCFRRHNVQHYLPSGRRLAVNAYLRGCVADGLFGYRNLCRVFAFKSTAAPLDEPRGLRWFKAEVKPGTPEARNLKWMSNGGTETKVGFDPKTGWLRAMVVNNHRGWRSVSLVTDVKEDPDTRGVFVLPEKLRAVPIIDAKTQEPVPQHER